MNKGQKVVMINVNGKTVTAETDLNLLEVLRANQFDVPSACTHPKGPDVHRHIQVLQMLNGL